MWCGSGICECVRGEECDELWVSETADERVLNAGGDNGCECECREKKKQKKKNEKERKEDPGQYANMPICRVLLGQCCDCEQAPLFETKLRHNRHRERETSNLSLMAQFINQIRHRGIFIFDWIFCTNRRVLGAWGEIGLWRRCTHKWKVYSWSIHRCRVVERSYLSIFITLHTKHANFQHYVVLPRAQLAFNRAFTLNIK